MITQKRQEEIDSATKANPVNITVEEAVELRMRNKTNFYMDINSGRLCLESHILTMRQLVSNANTNGMSDAAIAEELGLTEKTVRRILDRPAESKYKKALSPQSGIFKQVGTDARAEVTIEAISPERLAEIDNATPENPVDITLEESRALHLANSNHFQMETGAGKFNHPVQPGSIVDRALKMKSERYTEAEIADTLGLDPSALRSIFARVNA
jgi:predicted transcriptional regulator